MKQKKEKIRFKGKELEFISFVKRDGSGTILVGTPWDVNSGYPKIDSIEYPDDDNFTLTRLSLSQETYIASGFNTWVVRIKNS